jgi:hypothetical protein
MAITIRCFCLVLLLVIPGRGAESVWPAAVRRTTNDRFADLLDQLVVEGRFQEAEDLCRSDLDGLDPQSDAYARWTIRRSQIMAAQAVTQSTFDDTQIALAQKPVSDLLVSYPLHRRQLFLEAQRVAVQADAARHDVVTAAVSPNTADRNERAMKRLSRGTASLLKLAERVSDARAKLGSRRRPQDFALIDDLVRLQQQLQVDAVSLALMQTELFARGSQDRRAAATQAETAAAEAANTLPADSPARREVRRLQIEAIFRSAQYGRAESELSRFVDTLPKPLPATILAMQVRIDLASNRMSDAEARIEAYYGPLPATAPRSLEMDLARLEYLLASARQAGNVGDWLDTIEQRSGLYARRRAEALSLIRLRSAGHSGGIDPTLIAAQGEDSLRRGDSLRAAELFAAAAIAGSDGDRAIRHATQAAAAFIKAQQLPRASQILTQVALANRGAAAASATHLQAAITYSSSNLPESAAKVEAILKDHLATWPESEHGPAVRRWLIKLLRADGRRVAAAEVASRLPNAQINRANLEEAVALWQAAVLDSPSDSLESVMHRFRDAFKTLLGVETGRSSYRSAAACLLDRSMIGDLPKRSEETSSPMDTACDQLLEFRRQPRDNTLPAPPEPLIAIVSWRLMRDGRQYPQMRIPIATAINSWSAADEPSLDRAERLVWRSRILDAAAMLRTLVDFSPQRGEMMGRAAALLGASDNGEAKAQAIKLWDELAAGVPTGSGPWHDAKLASIRLLGQTGKSEEASRRAKYILLTSPPAEPKLKQQYQSASGP